jgi:transposase
VAILNILSPCSCIGDKRKKHAWHRGTDGGYNAWQVDAAVAKVPQLRLDIVNRSDNMKGVVVRPRRWVVERAFSWFGRTWRPAECFENLAKTLATFVTLASLQLALRRLARTQVVMVAVCKAWTADLRRRPGQRRSRADSGRSEAGEFNLSDRPSMVIRARACA